MPPAPPPKAAAPAAENAAANFIRNIVDDDLAKGRYAARKWGGHPGTAAVHQAGAPDPARIRTRFPPEPNGYLHIGHAKSICLNFGLARDYGGACHMRFDDTNPTKEEQEYVDSIQDAVKWLGFDWGSHLYFASDYFDLLYAFAEKLIEAGHAYVDSVSAEEMRSLRGTLTEPGRDSPYRRRTPAENLDLFRRMKAGEFADGAHVLRLKIDMGSPNVNMRDPVAYRIRHAAHHRTGDKWCIYPMYDYTHGVSDALENITHSDLHAGVRRPPAAVRLAEPAARRTRPAQHAAAAADRVRAPQSHLHGAVQAQADPARRGAARRRVGRSAHAHARRCAPPRLHARGDAALRRAHRRRQVGQHHRHERSSRTASARISTNARRAPSPCSIRSGSSSTTGRRATSSRPRRRCIRIIPNSASAASRFPANCGSSARTSPRRRPRATSASFPATWCGCASATW